MPGALGVAMAEMAAKPMDVDGSTRIEDLVENGPLSFLPDGGAGNWGWNLDERESKARRCLQNCDDGPLRDFSVTMPNLNTVDVDFHAMPNQLKAALMFLRSVGPRMVPIEPSIDNGDALLPPPKEEHRGRRTVVLDLDETLVHCIPSQLFAPPTNSLRLRIEVVGLDAFVYIRPYAQMVLRVLAKMFEVVVFTASAAVYADQVLDYLDPGREMVAYRLYRQHCTQIGGGHFKDMRRLGRKLENIVLVDNSPLAMGLTPDNGILCSSWFGDDNRDTELLKLLLVLQECYLTASIPAFLETRYGFSAFLKRQRDAHYAELL